jgi:hypothetical protein
VLSPWLNQALPRIEKVTAMNYLKSLTFAAAMLSFTAANAQDGSDRSLQATEKFRLAQQELREKNRQAEQSSELVDASESKPKKESGKSES